MVQQPHQDQDACFQFNKLEVQYLNLMASHTGSAVFSCDHYNHIILHIPTFIGLKGK